MFRLIPPDFNPKLMFPVKLNWQGMPYGNCLIGLLVIIARLHRKGQIIVLRNNDCWVPHLMYLVDETYYHYKLERDVMPHPLCYLVFKGRFVKQNAAAE